MRIALVVSVLSVTAMAFAADKSAGVGSDKQPVAIAKAADPIKIDGDGADWAKIAPLPAPYSKKAAGMLKLAWRDDGLYGLVEVADATIAIDDAAPWTADCMELWLDKDFSRGTEMGANSTQIAMAPNPTAGAGKAVVVIAQGTVDAATCQVMWKPIKGGYAIEFFIPAKELAPAKFAEGTKLGMNYAVDNSGAPVEQFFTDKDTDSAYSNPSLWGAIQLGK